MKTFASRSLAAIAIVATLGVGVPAVASASTTTTTTTTFKAGNAQKVYRQGLKVYQEERRAIDVTYQAAVQSAMASYESSMSNATSSAQRSAARAAMRLAIVQASAVRQQALVTLGNPPTPPKR